MLGRSAWLAFAVLASPLAAFAAGPAIDVVVGPQAEAIEKFAADELAGQLKKLFDAEVRIGDAALADAANVIYLGTKKSCPIAAQLGDAWPKLSEQGHALKTIEIDGRKALLVAGGSPRAVLWSAYEYGWKNGVRYFLFGDLYPVTKPVFTVAGLDHTIELQELGQIFFATGDALLGPESWDLNEHRKYLNYAAKRKCSTLFFDLAGWEKGTPMRGLAIRVDGDTAGRAAFNGAKVFENPEFAGAESIEARQAIGKRLVAEFRAEARRLGIDTSTGSVRLRASDLFQTSESWQPSFGAMLLSIDHYMGPPENCSFDELLTPVCGEEVAPRVAKAYELSSHARTAIQNNLQPDDDKNSQSLLGQYDVDAPPPAWWGEVRTHYLNAMNEMYRANTRAREGGRAFTLYYARRFEFGFEYMNAVEAVRNAGIAKRKGDRETQIAELEKAIDSVTNACNAMAAVSRSPSDRGIIAVMNEYGYRPLLKLLEEADAAP